MTDNEEMQLETEQDDGSEGESSESSFSNAVGSASSISLKQKIEAILFAAGRKVTLAEIADLCSIKAQGLIKEAVKELKSDLDHRGSSILLTEEADGWKFTVKEAYLSLVQNIVPHTELDHALLETLAVIAWRQPVLQSEVVRIRSSAAYEHIKVLLDMGFISKEKKGRSFVLKATGKFFDYFDLPGKEAVKEMFKNIEAAYDQQKGKDEQKGVDDFEEEPHKPGLDEEIHSALDDSVSKEEKKVEDDPQDKISDDGWDDEEDVEDEIPDDAEQTDKEKTD